MRRQDFPAAQEAQRGFSRLQDVPRRASGASQEEAGEPQGTNMSQPRKPREGPKEGDSRQPGPQDRTGGRQEVARTGRTPAGRFGKISWRLGRISGRLGKIPGRLGKIHWAPSPAAQFEAVF